MSKAVPKKTESRRPDPLSPSLLAAALGALGEGVFISGRKLQRDGLRICFANGAFREMTGYSEVELLGRGHGFMHVEREDRNLLARWLRTSHPSRPLSGEGYLVRKDGTTLSTAWTFSPVHDGAGKVTHIVATYRDTTEKRDLQEMLVNNQRLEAVGRLAGGVAHDFNNLISVINGYCEILAADVVDQPKALHEVSEIHNAGRKAATLTRQLLAFGRQQPMNPQVSNLNQLVSDNAGILTRLLGTSGKLELELDPKLWNVRTDRAQFQQVLLNLTLNARDALRDKGRVIITTRNLEIKPGANRRAEDTPPGNYVVLMVGDNGTGMDEETQKHLFEPFYTTKSEGKGSGLGLATVYDVVHQSRGTIKARSELLVGSTFEIVLPSVNEPVDGASAKPSAVITPLPVTRGHESVLIVEDDDVLRKMVAGMLTADGYRVTDARNHAEGLERAKAASKPIQLLVVNLAGDGEKLAKALYKIQSDLRVLNACNHNATRDLNWLDDDHQMSLPKPFALSELVKAVRQLLDA